MANQNKAPMEEAQPSHEKLYEMALPDHTKAAASMQQVDARSRAHATRNSESTWRMTAHLNDPSSGTPDVRREPR